MSTNNNYPPAVVLGLCPTGLAVVRSLGRRGTKVYGVDFSRFAVGFSSKYCRSLAYFHPDTSPDALLDRLIKFARGSGEKPVLFATNDDFLGFVAENSEALREFFLFPKLDAEVLDGFLNKERFYKTCIANDVPIPTTFFLSDGVDFSSIGKAIRYPSIIKPIYTHKWAKKYGLIKAFKVHNLDELKSKYEELGEMKSNVLIQEVVGGGDENIYIFGSYFDTDSCPTSIFTGRKLRQYPPEFGTTTLAESLREPKVVELSLRLLKAMRFHGICDVEFKKDPRDGIFKIMEINPRAGRWYSLTDAAGINVVYNAYLDLIDRNPVREERLCEHVKWLFLYRDIATVFSARQNGSSSLAAGGWKSLLTRYGSVNGNNKVHAVLAKDDLKPAIGYPVELLAKLLRK